MKPQFDLKNLHPSVKRFLRMNPREYGAQDVDTMENRVALLDALYEIDGRDSKDHPFHGTYTGLFREYIKD